MSAEFAAEAKTEEAAYAERARRLGKTLRRCQGQRPRSPAPTAASARTSAAAQAKFTVQRPWSHRLLPYAIRGTIWYQGENNASRGQGYLYRRTVSVDDRRLAGGNGASVSFHSYSSNWANYGRVPEESTWPELREAQAMALGLANTGMAVTIDIGNPTDIHPRNKQDVGLRLALAARAICLVASKTWSIPGPVFRQATRDTSGLRLWFDPCPVDGLEARGGPLGGFQVAGSDGKFVAAKASISGNTVLVSSDAIKDPGAGAIRMGS